MPSCSGIRQGDMVMDFKTKRKFVVADWSRNKLIAEDGFSSTHYRVIRLASHQEHIDYIKELELKKEALEQARISKESADNFERAIRNLILGDEK